MKRKSPIKHHVRPHIRNGIKVTDYDRGHGEHPVKFAKPFLGNKNKGETEKYQVTVRYTNLPTESFAITGFNFPQVVDQGLLSRINITPPMEVKVTRIGR